MGVIFDLDQTLIDSTPVEPLRKARKWSDVYKIIPELRPYAGIAEMLDDLFANRIPVCIVTSTPRPYCERVINHWKWRIDATVCYHDTKYKKPHPEPIFLGIKKINVPKTKVLVVGDDVKDILAAKNAGVLSVGALWGVHDSKEIIKSEPYKVFQRPTELSKFLLEFYL